jgi:O-antigen/teichoic acid export membrane protein
MQNMTATRAAEAAQALSHEIRRAFAHPLVNSAGLLTGAQYVAAALGFVKSLTEARLLGSVDYGTAAIIIAYPMLLCSFAAVKSGSITTRYIASFRAAGRNGELLSICKLGYIFDFSLALISFALVAASAWWIAGGVYDKPEIFWLMIVYSASYPLSSLSGTSVSILSSCGRFRALAALQMIDKLIMLILVAGVLWAGFGVAGMIIANAFALALDGVMMMLVATYVLRRDRIGCWWRAAIEDVAPLRAELSAFFGWNYLLVTLNGLVGQAPLLILGRVRGPEEAGFYRLAMSLMSVSAYAENSMSKIAYPALSARFGREHGRSLRETLRGWTWKGGIPIAILVALSVPFLPILVPLIFGPSYVAMVPGAQMMMLSVAVGALFFWLSAYYYASGKIGLWTKAYGVYTASFLGLSWWCIREWGFLGVAGLIAIGKPAFAATMAVIVLAAWSKLQP